MDALPISDAAPSAPVTVDAGSPRATDDVDAALFTPWQMAAAALVGTPIAAGLLWFLNVRALGRRHAALAFVAGSGLTLGPFAAATWLQKELFLVAVLVLWPLGYGLAAALSFPTRAARSWAVVVGCAVAVCVFLISVEQVFGVRGKIVPRVPGDAVATAGEVNVVFSEDVDPKDALAVANALDGAGFGQEGKLRLRLSNHVGTEPVLRLRVPRGGDDVVGAGKAVAATAANALGRCLRMRLVLPSEAEVASGRSCPPDR